MNYVQNTAAHLVTMGYAPPKALALAERWRSYLLGRQAAGKSTASSAQHLARFAKERTVCSCGSRDCGCAGKTGGSANRRDASPPRMTRARKPRPDAGEMRTSAKGIPYRVCPHGMTMQALLFPRGKYTEQQARAWVIARKGRSGFARIEKVTTEANHVRVRLIDPKFFVKGSFRLIQLKGYERHGVRGLVACPRVKIMRGGKTETRAGAGATRKAA